MKTSTIVLVIFAVLALSFVIAPTAAYCPGVSASPPAKCLLRPPVAYVGGISAVKLPRAAGHKSGCYYLDDSSTPNYNNPTTCDPVSLSPSTSGTVTGQCGCYFCVLGDDTYNGVITVSSNIYSITLNTTASPQPVSMQLMSISGQGGAGGNPPSNCVWHPDQ